MKTLWLVVIAFFFMCGMAWSDSNGEIIFADIIDNTVDAGVEITFGSPVPQHNITFHDTDSGEIGFLSWEKGYFEFEGKAEKSAIIFFENCLKPLVDEYIKSKQRQE